jgi:tetratricopeptide (TPR) repeat protein
MIRRGAGPGLPLKLAVLCGALVSALLCALLLFLALRPDRDYIAGSAAPSRDVFHRLLRDYDRVAGAVLVPGPEPEGLEALSGLLDKMEGNIQGVESWLSLLKRRRALALAFPRMLSRYQASSRRAADVFPWSEPLAAVAAAAALWEAPITANTGAALRQYADRINETSLCPLALGIVILTGGFNSPALAAEARGEALLSAGLPLIRPGMPDSRGDRLIANLALLRLVRGDYRGAEAQLQGISRPEIPELWNFLGEYYYDFGDPLRAAEIFNRAGGGEALLRSADALWLGGKTGNARNIWRALGAETGAAEGPGAGPGDSGGPLRLRSLYNLAMSAPSAGERDSWFALLYQAGREEAAPRRTPWYQYGLIGHSRTLAPYEALAILDLREPEEDGPEDGGAEESGPGARALRDLEILRRRGELWHTDRTVAETWALLGRYPGDGRLYQWAAWYFEHQRRYDEMAVLVKNAGYRGIREPWLDLHAGLRDMEAGRLDQAEKGLRALSARPGNRLWQAEANLGLIMERRHAPGGALEQYEIALSRAGTGKAASRLQLRAAGCLRALGRAEESRRALRYSLDLDPDNLAARLELRRLEQEAPGPAGP